MSVSAAMIQQAYRLLLGRDPNPASQLQFQTPHHLRTALLNSKEFHEGPAGRKRRIGWPQQQIFVSQAARVLYNPIGKNACTFMKQQMARMSGIAELDYLLPDIHFLTDHASLGLQLSDYTDAEIKNFLNSQDYLRVVLLRDPRQRLLSAWIEKFAIGRTNVGNIQHTRSIIDPVQARQGLEAPDYERGITFRDFINQVTADPTARLDPHWAPQRRYLADIHWDRLFAFEDIEAMVALLEQRSGIELPRMRQNTTDSGSGEARAGVADMLPADVLAGPRADFASFYDEDLTARVLAFFAEDYALLERARQDIRGS